MKSAIYINNPNDRRTRLGNGGLKIGHWLILMGVLATLLGSSCATNLYLEPGQYLMKGEPSFSKGEHTRTDTTLRLRIESLKEIGQSTVSSDLLYSSVKSRPNRRMIFPKVYLHLYNLGRSMQRYEYPPERWLHFFSPDNHLVDTIASFLVNIVGEPPMVIDSALLAKDNENLENVYFSEGFFHAKVFYRVDTCKAWFNRHKANVTFVAAEGKAAIIDKIRTPLIEDEEMRKVLLRNLTDSYLRSGDNYREDNFSAERGRIAAVMRDNGYFTFSPKMIYFDIDTLPPDTLGTLPNNPAIKEYQPIWVQVKIPDRQPNFKIGRVSMVIEPATFEYDVDDMMKVVSPGTMTDSLRRVWHLTHTQYSDSSKITFITYERVLERINLNFLEKLITLVEGDQYALTTERKTQMRLQNLGIFKYVLIKPNVNEADSTVDFMIQAVLLQRYQAKAGFEGFFENDPILKSNLPGIGAEIGFRDKLLFSGAEKLDLSAKGSTRFYRDAISSSIQVFWEGTASASLIFPRILSPGLASKNIQGFEPNTSFTTNFSRQSTSIYSRNSAGLDWNYSWYHSTSNKKAKSSFSPYVVNFIQSELKQQFVDLINNIKNDAIRTLIIQDYRQRFSSWGNYKFSYNNAVANKIRHSLGFVGTLQMGGNTPFLIDRFSNLDESYKDHKIKSIFYGQYFKTTLEFRNNWPIGRHAAFVMRNYAGVAKPWNYTPFVPFESRFFGGGSNSMRGWQSNSLGPGTYSARDSTNSEATGQASNLIFGLSPGGEFVFESNFELRFDVYKFVKMAIFSDAGNVWFLPSSIVDFPGAKLSKDTYYQLGLDAGVGLRLDFGFFLFRVDLAKQIYAPDVKQFVIKSLGADLGSKRLQLNFGIGYPF